VGGSYAGALSAWYRLKYPHLTIGAWSASGVVNAFRFFPEFDQQIATSAGDECAQTLRQVTQGIESQMPSIKKSFGPDAVALSDDDFLYFVADTMGESVQYGSRILLCSSVMASGDPVQNFVNYTNSYFVGELGNSPAGYNTVLLSNPLTGGDGRAWWWQTCTEVGWFQIAPENGSIRSHRVNKDYFQNACHTIFGIDLFALTEDTNIAYGGNQITGTNIFFTNGIEDPWQWAGVRASLSSTETAVLINCTQCAHCVDLYTPQSTDAPELLAARLLFIQTLDGWLAN